MTKPIFARLPGFRDFTPDEFAFREHILSAWRRVSTRYGFLEYDGPPLEPVGLYVEKSGEEILGQLYNFQDKGEREVSLRPEMTPSLARILADHSRSLAKPIRWFSVPQLFRYERQQRGRLREHFQWNVDVVGEESVAADAEVLAVGIDGLRELGFGSNDIVAKISDRRLLSSVLSAFGVDKKNFANVFSIIDKLERSDPKRSLERLQTEGGMSESDAHEVLELFEGKTLEEIALRLGDRKDVSVELERLDSYLGKLEAMGLGPYVELDLRIVRGLAYYTGIVFEIFDKKGELRAICGGGRYDGLLELVGGDPLPAVGFGMGDVVLGELIREKGLVPDIEANTDYYIVILTEEYRDLALSIAHSCRDRGLSVLYGLSEQSVRKQFVAAGKYGAREVIVLGPDEVSRGFATIRDMDSGEEREVPIEELR